MNSQNDNQQKEPFYKYRGVTKSLSAGISFLTDNFLYIVKASLPFALVYAGLCTAISYILSNSMLLQTILGKVSSSSISAVTLGTILAVLIILLLFDFFLFNGLIYRLIHLYSHDIPLKRFSYVSTLKSAVKYSVKGAVFFCITFLIGVICGYIAMSPIFINVEGNVMFFIKLGAVAFLYLAIIVFALPFAISLPSIYLEKGGAFKNALKGYKRGLKIWGKLFCMALLLTLLIIFIMFVLSMPSIILINSYHAATLSQLNGDPVTMPLGFNLWYIVVLFITFYLNTFTLWLSQVPYCYLYASVRSDEKEAKNTQYTLL